MKAVIVDLNGNNAVVLRDDGRFEKIKNKNYAIGQQIVVQPQLVRFPRQAAIAASAAVVIAACGGMGSYTWSNPISYVSLDINPSIAYSLNEFNRVISVSGMNDEGVAVVDAIGDSLKNTDITTALTITVEQLSTDAYLDAENTNYMVIGVYSDRDDKADALMSTVDAFSANTVDTCSVTTVNVSKETKESADSYGITGGKMELINEIADVAADPQEVDPAALADLTVAELEQTKAAAASGASVSEAVAAATPSDDQPQTPEEPKKDPKKDPNAVASDSKPSDDTVSTSSDKKDQPSAETPSSANNSPAVADDDPAPPADQPAAPGNPVTGPAANAHPGSNGNAGSTDKNGNGSSDKKDNENKSPSKGETTSSEKKDETNSSDKKGNSSSSEKKDAVSEDNSQQTNSNVEEIPEESIHEIPSPSFHDIFDDEIIIAGNMLS